MICRSIALGICGAGIVLAGEPPALTDAEMQPVLRMLQTQYAQPQDFNRAALTGLLKDHPDTVQLLTVPDAPPAPAPLVNEMLTPRVACVRPGSFRQDDVPALSAALTKLSASETATLILDLRNPAADAEPATAVPFASLFLPKDTPLFTLTSLLKTSAAPVWERDLIVLIDRDTCNVAEILAAVLKAKQRAFILGTASRGRTAAINTLPVRKVEGGNLILRYTAQRVVFAEGADPFGKGVAPDMSVTGGDSKDAVFAHQAKEGLASTVFHKPRPRPSEASLVARTNPELPERIALTAGQPVEYDHQLTDRPLQLAMDILTAKQALAPPAGK